MSRVRITQHITAALLIISGFLIAGSGMAEPAKAQLIANKDLSWPMAFMIAQTAMETCTADGLRVSVTVVGRNAEVLLQARGEGSPVTIDFSFRKAYTSASLRIPSGEVVTRLKENPHWAVATLPNIVADRGALPIKVGDQTIGAVGVAGAPSGEKNEICAKAGIDKIADQLK